MGYADIHRAAHQAFNQRDYPEVVSAFTDEIEFHDHPRQFTTKGPQEFLDYLRGWAASFSDAHAADARYLEGPSHSLALFHAKGTNDGPLGPLPASGRQLYLPMCEILHYDDEGRVTRGEIFYDTTGIMVQLGHMEPPA